MGGPPTPQDWLEAFQVTQEVAPGRKTDVKDCVGIAQLPEHGLIRGSVVPPPPIWELRDLTRYRKPVIQERTREANRLRKVLEDVRIKLASVARCVLNALQGYVGHGVIRVHH